MVWWQFVDFYTTEIEPPVPVQTYTVCCNVCGEFFDTGSLYDLPEACPVCGHESETEKETTTNEHQQRNDQR